MAGGDPDDRSVVSGHLLGSAGRTVAEASDVSTSQLPPHYDARPMGAALLLFVLCVVVFPMLGFWASTWMGHLYGETPTVLLCWVVIPASLSFVCASLARRPILSRLAWAIASGLTAPVAFAVLVGVLSR